MIPLLVGVIALGCVAAPRPVFAQTTPASKSEFKKLIEEALALYKAKDYRAALAAFNKANAIDPKPNLVFNIAKCHEALGENVEAIEKYKQYADTPGADAPSRAKALETAKALQEIEDAKKPKPPTVEKPEAPPVKEVPTPTPTQSVEPPSPSPLPWILIGTGVAFAGAGGVFAALAASARSEARDNCRDVASGLLCKSSADAALSRDGTFSVLADVGFGVGIVAAGIGVVTLLTRDPVKVEALRAVRVTAHTQGGQRLQGAEIGIGGSF